MADGLSQLLFKSYRLKALNLFLLNPESSFYVREVSRLTGTVAGTINKELSTLEQLGILRKSRQGNQLLYQANTRCTVYEELSALLRKLQVENSPIERSQNVASFKDSAYISPVKALADKQAISDILSAIKQIALHVDNKIQLSHSPKAQKVVKKQLEIIAKTLSYLSSKSGFTLVNIEAMMESRHQLQLDDFWEVWIKDFPVLEKQLKNTLTTMTT